MASSTAHGFHMNGGEGTPRRVQKKLAPLVEAAVADLCSGAASGVPRSIGVADLSCSSGPKPNTLFLVSVAVDALSRRCAAAGAGCPEVRVYINDLLGNDFNTVFRQLPAFQQQRGQFEAAVAGDVFAFGPPGSFCSRLFPLGSLHMVISSISHQWLSQVPKELADDELVNRGNINAGRTSSPAVIEAYARQFDRDLTLFLLSRAVEGLVDAAKLDSYNIPLYKPCAEEMWEIVDAAGSFEIVGMESCNTATPGFLGPDDAATPCEATVLARIIRAVHEPMLTGHFGDGLDMDELVKTAEAHFDRLIREGNWGWLIHVRSLSSEEMKVLSFDHFSNNIWTLFGNTPDYAKNNFRSKLFAKIAYPSYTRLSGLSDQIVW
ncbi:hypothetical protein EJB05_21254, partial [Eragrostis curvula]